MAPHAQGKEHAKAANIHITTSPEQPGIPTSVKLQKENKNTPNKKESLAFIYLFTGQQTNKEVRNAKASLIPVWKGKTPTELTKSHE